MKISIEEIKINPQTEVFFLYKWNPLFSQKLEKWLLEKNHYLILLEEEGFSPDPFIQNFLEKDSIRIHIFSSGVEKKERFKAFFWEFLLLKKEIFTSSVYRNSPAFLSLQKNFEELSLGVDLVASELNEMDLLYKNVYQNFWQIETFQKASDYKEAFQGKPAFLIGAGPSLKKQEKLLKKMENKALFFAAGTAYEALSSFGIKPHFVASVDKEAISSRFASSDVKNIPLFFQLRSNPQVVQKPFLTKVLTSDHPFYLLQNRLYKALNIPDFSDSGWNVATFFLSQMLYMGCGPIFFIGLDFSFSPGRYYAHKKEKREEELIRVSSQNGKELFTKKDFLLAAQWIEKLAEKYPGKIYNLSEGLSFQGIEEISFSEIEKKFSENKIEEEALIKKIQEIPSYTLSFSEKKRTLEELKKSFENCLSQVNKLFSFLEKHFTRLLQKKHFSSYFLEKAWEKEIAYQDFLLPLWHNWKGAILREKQKEVPLFLHEWLQKLLFFQKKIEEQLILLKEV